MSGLRIYIPGDATAVACGADNVAVAVAAVAAKRNLAVDVVRNGSRGMHWLEPMLEVATDKGRIAYGLGKSASDGVIAGFTVGLVEGYKPEKLPPLQANLDRAGKGLKEVCDTAVQAAPASGTKGIVEDLAKGAVEPVVDALKAAAGALWGRHVKMEDLEIETIKGQLDAAK